MEDQVVSLLQFHVNATEQYIVSPTIILLTDLLPYLHKTHKQWYYNVPEWKSIFTLSRVNICMRTKCKHSMQKRNDRLM